MSLPIPGPAPASAYTDLGTFELIELGLGEISIEHVVKVAPGTWRALFLDDDAVDDLIDAGGEDVTNQLVLVHADRELPSGRAFPPLRHVASLPFEAARFTAADVALREVLEAEDAFYDHLDGVHGVLAVGRGVHVMMGGDGVAEVWVEAVPDPQVVVVQLR